MLRPYQSPILAHSVWQVVSTFSLYIACIVAMYAGLHVSIWLTLGLTIPASGLIVRIFMLQHDCGHRSLFRSSRMNEVVGMLCSMITLTPFAYWRRLHARHHGNWNNLDGRGIPADFFSDCITVAEYGARSRTQRFLYRISHQPLLMNFLLPPLVFILLYRLPFDTPWSCRREHVSVLILNLALLGMFAGLVLVFGFKSVLIVQLPTLIMAAIIGIWLFSVQHRFEDAQWARDAGWTHAQASLEGTSYLMLPRLFQWFSGNIGLHHVHHLSPGIPNYRLQACHDECPAVTASVTSLTFRQALNASTYTLWNETTHRMVQFPA
jgi:omega-6 fatty acid desaturase (delta-12 desaturase)